MEVQQVVVLTENGDLQLTSLSRHVLFHTINSLRPLHATHALLPKSGSRKIDNLTSEIPQAVVVKGPRKKASLTETILGSTQLVPSIEVHRFLDRATSVADFTLILERKLVALSRGEIDPDKLHEICWSYYEMEKKRDISIPQWFSTTCTYRLWLIFCCVQEQTPLNDTLSALTANEVIKRLVELCGYTWNEAYRYDDTEFLEFPQYLRAIAGYFTRLRLEMSLTCEVIVDMLDEIVHGVLKKGYLTKKGHKRKNMKKRWFVLQRNIMKYFDTREGMSLKGQLILNSNTEVKGIQDKGKKKCWFVVTCGHTGKQFEIYADDQRSKHEWMLAIKKAIALAKVMDGSLKQDDYTEYLTGFYLLKYGTPRPSLSRQDSTVRQMKYHATLKAQRKRLSGKDRKGSKGVAIGKDRSDSLGEDRDPFSPCDEYIEMDVNSGHDISSTDSSGNESDGYVHMDPPEGLNPKSRSRSLEMLDAKKEKDQDNLSKSCSVSKPKSLKLINQKAETLHEEDNSLSDSDVYDEADFLPRYKVPTHDPQLGGYIEVTSAGGQDRVPIEKTSTKKNMEEDAEVVLLTARTTKLGQPGEEIQSLSQDKYLTIIRDTPDSSSNHGNPPPLPIHSRKSPTTDLILGSPEPIATMMSQSYTDPNAPPLKPKPKKVLERGGSMPLEYAPPLPRRPHRDSEPIIERSGTYASGKRPPPLPPIPSDNSDTVRHRTPPPLPTTSGNDAPPLPPK